MNNQALVEASQKEVATTSEAGNLIAAIERAAMNPDVDVDKMERLLNMQERILDKNAEAAFNVSLNAAQAELGQIGADANNPQTRSKYATYAKLDSVVRSIYVRHGFSLSFDTGETDKENTVKVVCYVSHRGGHTRTYHADIDASGKGAKGNDVMTKTHATGSAMSYGKRYLLILIFNLSIGEHDDDGSAAGSQEPSLVSGKQVKELDSVVASMTEESKAKFTKWLEAKNITDFTEISTGAFDKILEVANKGAK